MKKRLLIFLVVAIPVGVLAWGFAVFGPETTKIPDEASRVYIKARMAGGGEIEITEPGEAALLRRLFGRSYKAEFDSPACPFGAVEISFVHNGRRLDFYPAGDDCELVRYGTRNKFFTVTAEEKERLKELTRRYERGRGEKNTIRYIGQAAKGLTWRRIKRRDFALSAKSLLRCSAAGGIFAAIVRAAPNPLQNTKKREYKNVSA